MDFLKKIFSGVIKAGAMALARLGATLAGGALLTWLLSHHVSADFATRLVGDLQDAILAATGAGLLVAGVGASLKDVNAVDAKMAVAAAAGYDHGQAQALQQAAQVGAAVQADADQARLAAVANAMKTADKAAPSTKAELVASLKAGAF